MRCTVNGISHQGEGVARIDGKAVFIPNVLPGEIVDIEITDERSRYSRGIILSIIQSSPERTEPDCPHYYDCGGCAYQHVEYSRELELKRQVIQDNLKRIGHIDIEVKPVLALASPWRYRNKVTWHIVEDGDDYHLAYYRGGSHDQVKISDCRIISTAMQEAGHYLEQILSEMKFKSGASAVVRQSAVDGSLLLILYGLNEVPENSTIDKLKTKFASIYYRLADGKTMTRANGKEYLQGGLGDIECRISPEAFFQVNLVQADRMMGIIKDMAELKGTQNILDAYCGTGAIALNLAAQAMSVTGIESNPAAVADAEYNARRNNINNAEFITGPCEKVLPALNKSFDLVLLDPPRSGCQPEVIAAVIASHPSKIIYVSCNPATLARDLARFKQSGYNPVEVQPLDMFPRTHHVETVVLMSRVQK